MKCKLSRTKILFLTILIIMGFFSSAWDRKRVEVTDIEISSLENQTRVNITTSSPVKFLFYETENPPRLIIDFIGTNIYSEKPERVIFREGNIREIRSIFYDSETDKGAPYLDSLVLSFAAEVAINVKAERNGIVLEVEGTKAVYEQDRSAELARAKILAGIIALEKKFAAEKDKELLMTGKEERVEIEKPPAEVISITGLAGSVESSYRKDFHIEAAEEELNEQRLEAKPILLSTESEKNYNLFLLGLISVGLISAILAVLLKFQTAPEVKKEAYEAEMLELDKFFSQHQNLSNRRTEESLPETDNALDKCLEKREFARFDVPGEIEKSIKLDLETEELGIISANLKNISLGGISFELRKETRIPSILQIELKFPESQEGNQILTKVVWFKRKGENSLSCGLSFMMLTSVEEKKIRQYLTEIL
jgi:hypothetical protein